MTAGRYRVVVAFFTGHLEAEQALAQLLRVGVPREAIRVVAKEVGHIDDLGFREASKAAHGGALGALAGGLVGAAVGAFGAGGALMIPSLGAVLAGPIVAALAGAGAAGALGGLVGFAVGARLPAFEAAYLDDAVAMGGALVAVRCGEEHTADLTRLLGAHGGRSVARGPVRAP